MPLETTMPEIDDFGYRIYATLPTGNCRENFQKEWTWLERRIRLWRSGKFTMLKRNAWPKKRAVKRYTVGQIINRIKKANSDPRYTGALLNSKTLKRIMEGK